MTEPLTALECELLEAVVEDRENAAAVLGDYWIEHVDEARGAFLNLHLGANRDRIDLADEEARLAVHSHAWRAPLRAAGYRERDLALVDGFLQWPLSLPADHPLDGDPDLVRLSPRYYRELGTVRYGAEHAVHAAEEITPRTKRRVVIKTPHDTACARVLEREATLLARLSHPNLPTMLGYAVRIPRSPEPSDEACRSIVLAWSGIDLGELIRSARDANQTLGVAFAISVALQLLDAIAELDRLGIVHLEVRPDHVTVAADGTVTLIDFGYVKSDLPHPNTYGSPARRINSYRFRHMSPEQVRGLPVMHASDVFSAAGLISQLVANVHPAPQAENDFDTLLLIRETTQVASVELPAVLRAVLQRALAMDPAPRPTARALRASLLAGAQHLRIDVGPHVIAQRLVELGVPS